MPDSDKPGTSASDQREGRGAFRDAVVSGLARPHKTLPTAYLYDARGSRLFEEITALPSYYQTRTEIVLLQKHAGAWTASLPPDTVLVEFGSGSSRKTEILLANSPNITTYAPIDVSAEALTEATTRLAQTFPELEIVPIIGDFQDVTLPSNLSGRPHAGFFPGSTIGNLKPDEARGLLETFARILGQSASLLIGVDLQKSESRLIAAYDDPEGVTAAFNLNILAHINRELGANFDLEGFTHKASYNRDENRIEMHLVAQRSQTVDVQGDSFTIAAGETIHTENSYKYTIDGFSNLARNAGWQVSATFVDDDALFSIHVLEIA